MALLLALVIAFNYSVVNIENEIIDPHFGSFSCVVLYFLLYALAYYTTLLIILFFGNRRATDVPILKHKRTFFLKSLCFLFIISLDAGGYYHQWIREFQDPKVHYFVWYAFSNFKGFLIVIFGILIVRFLFDRGSGNLYGMTLKNFSFIPYLWMLLIMVPIIYIASIQPDFKSYYPIFKPDKIGAMGILDVRMVFLLLELFYALDFVGTEWIFRGALTLGLMPFLGTRAVLPMVSVYAFLHFGKPLGETIGSVFGGYILGVIALRSGSIFGGILIHIGVAFIMDFFALLQR